jgi:prolyl-tRNA editing enzyme YbaK/EbsC (Cys-tRNA(Pro) deacylase)
MFSFDGGEAMSLLSEVELEMLGVSFETIVVPKGVHTVKDVQLACYCAQREVIKTLLFVGEEPVVVLLAGNKRVDASRLKALRGDESLRLADKVEVHSITGLMVGALSPFGLPGNTDLIADDGVRSLALLILGSGQVDTLLKMTLAEFLKAFRGSFAALATATPGKDRI